MNLPEFERHRTASIEADKFPCLTKRESEIAGLRIELERKLLHVHQVLLEANVNVLTEVIIGDDDLLSLQLKNSEKKGKESNKEIESKIINYVYRLFIKARELKTYHFFSDEGHLYSLANLKTDLRNRYGDFSNELTSEIDLQLQKHIEKQSCYADRDNNIEGQADKQTNSNCQGLHFIPPKYENVINSKAKKTAFALIKNVFPIRHISNTVIAECPIITPAMLLCCYKEFITSEQLFHFGAIILKSPQAEVDFKQKMRVLNFFLKWIEINLYPQDMPLVRHGLAKLHKSCLKLNNKEVSKFFNKIHYFFDLYNNLFVKLNTSLSSNLDAQDYLASDLYLKKIADLGIDCDQFHSFVKGAAKEIKCISASLIAGLTPFCFITEKHSEAMQKIGPYHYKILQYVTTTYATLKKAFFLESLDVQVKDRDADPSKESAPHKEFDRQSRSFSLRRASSPTAPHGLEKFQGSLSAPMPYSVSSTCTNPPARFTRSDSSPPRNCPEKAPSGRSRDANLSKERELRQDVEFTSRSSLLRRTSSSNSPNRLERIYPSSGLPASNLPSTRFSKAPDPVSRDLNEKAFLQQKNEERCHHLILLFIALADELFTQNDFFSSSAIVQALSSDELGIDFSNMRSKKEAGGLKYKSKEKETKVVQLLNKYYTMSLYFNTTTFRRMHEKTEEYQAEGKCFIPHVPSLRSAYIRRVGEIEKHMNAEKVSTFDLDASSIDFKYQALKTDLIWKSALMLRNLRLSLNQSTQNPWIQSDVKKRIFEQTGLCEEAQKSS